VRSRPAARDLGGDGRRCGGPDAIAAFRRGQEDVEADGPRVSGVGGGQRADHLAVRPEAGLERFEAGVEGGQVEAGADPPEPRAALDVGAEPVLLVLGEHLEHPLVDLQGRQRVGAPAPRGPGPLAEPLGQGSGGLRAPRGLLRRLLGGDAREDLGRRQEEVESGCVEGLAPHAHVVEPVLQRVGQPRHAVDAEHRRQPLQRVGGAEDGVEDLLVGLALAARVLEPLQVAVERLDGLLRLRHEVGQGLLRGAFGHRWDDGPEPPGSRRGSS
jgi:hypothetical protein